MSTPTPEQAFDTFFVYDVMDAVRPHVEDWFLDFIQKTKLPKKYFHEKENGVVRISLQLTPILGQTLGIWKKNVAPIVADVAKILLKGD